MDALARTQNSLAPSGIPLTFPLKPNNIIAFSLNFVGAATEIALIGTQCVGPGPTQCGDLFFEHHIATYLALMQAQLK